MKRAYRQLLLAMLPIVEANAQSLPVTEQDVELFNQHYQRVQLQLQQQRLDNELARLQREHAELTAGSPHSGVSTAASHAERSDPTVERRHRLISKVSFGDIKLTLYDVQERPHWHIDSVGADGGSAWQKP